MKKQLRRNPLESFLKDEWKLEKTRKCKYFPGETTYTLTRFRVKPYGYFCPYSNPGFISEDISVTVSSKGKIKSVRQLWYSEYWPNCYLDRKDKPCLDWTLTVWTSHVQLELLFLT